MKALILALSFVLMLAGMTPMTAEARRFGGGGYSGMQRSAPRTPPPAAPAKPAQAAPASPATAGAAAAAPRRSWMGPIAGLAAGLGLAALMSHLGMGAEFANIIMMALLAMVAFVAIRFLLNRFGRGGAPGRLAGVGAGPSAGSGSGASLSSGAMPFQRITQPAAGGASPWAPAAGATVASNNNDVAPVSDAAPLPAGFDAEGFGRVAKMIFIRMQAANDSGDLADLRHFTTPEMFAAVRLDLQERANVPQTTDVVRIDADVIEVAMEAERQLVSVRFHGLIREEAEAAAAPFNEVWHLVKPTDGSREWAIAGIQQAA